MTPDTPASLRAAQTGISLIELMISLAIGLLITSAMAYLYVNSKQTFRQQDNLARIQENGRFALDVISQDIRMAGYWGCAGRSISQPVNTLNNAATFANNFGVPIEGNQATGASTWAPVLDASITNVVSGTDVITLRGAFDAGTTVTQHPGGTPPGSADLKVTAGSGLLEGDVVLVSDCANAAIFQITNINNTGGGENMVHNSGAIAGINPGNATKALGKEYTGGEIMKLAVKTYYIRNNPAGRPALYRTTTGTGHATAAEELVENVENMQITYGVDTTGDRAVDSYVTADNVANWGQVAAVRVRLLLVSPDNNVAENVQTYAYVDTNNNGIPDDVVAGDRRLRFVFTTTVGVRNRLP